MNEPHLNSSFAAQHISLDTQKNFTNINSHESFPYLNIGSFREGHHPQQTQNNSQNIIGEINNNNNNNNSKSPEIRYSNTKIFNKSSKKNTSQHPNDDFSTDPIRKLRNFGRFPYKLAVNCLMLIILILIITLYHNPESIANERQRKAVLHQFLGEDYLAKDKEDIILKPTIYLQERNDVIKSIKDFVKVYFALSNTSVSELKYYYYANGGDGENFLHRALSDESPNFFNNNILKKDLNENKIGDDILNLSWVKPVSMNVDAYIYSQREHHGPSPQRSFSFLLTEKDPLGPFSDDEEEKDDDNDNNENENEEVEVNDNKNIINNNKRTKLHFLRGKRVNIRASPADFIAADTEDYLKILCAPRYDDITGLFFNPCRGSKEENNNNNNNKDDNTNAGYIFPLIDNMRTIQLTASVRHLTDNQESVTGFKVIMYRWIITKLYKFHSGGLVESNFDISVTTKRLQPKPHPRFFLSGILLILSLFDIMLRYRALKRISKYRQKIRAEQEAIESDESLIRVRESNINNNINTNSSTFTRSSGEVIRSTSDSSDASNNSNTPFSQSRQFLLRILKINPKNRKGTYTRNAGTLVPETTYTDFYDTWREQLQQSRGEGWQYIAIIADILTITYAIMSLVLISEISSTGTYETFENIVLGLSGLFLSVNMLAYLRYFPRIYFTVRATRHVIPKLILFALSISPLFLGFAFFYFIVFGPHSNGEFTDIGFAVVGLYFMMYGDAILPAINNAENSAFIFVTILANAMTIIFILLFMMTMLNLAMSITQHEWGLLRRRFGACLSVGNILFTVRSRSQVKSEALETAIANLELLRHIQHEEQLEGINNNIINNNNNNNNNSSSIIGLMNDDNINNNNINNNNSNNNREGGSFAPQTHDVADLYRRRLNELTEGILSEED